MLLTADSYEASLHLLSKEVVTAPVYYITAGTQPGQGAVLTRDRGSLRDLWALNTTTAPPNSWYLLETNYVSTVVLLWGACIGGHLDGM